MGKLEGLQAYSLSTLMDKARTTWSIGTRTSNTVLAIQHMEPKLLQPK